jgi:CubicO group peptidase (beta-lactamase class C family)
MTPNSSARRQFALFLLLLFTACAGTATNGTAVHDGGLTPDSAPVIDGSPPAKDGSVSVPPCPANAEALFAEIVDQLQAAITSNNVPGAAVAVVCGGNQVFTRGLGVKRTGSTEPVTEDTRFQWASSTKMFTAATAVALMEDGVVDLNAPISRYLPSVSYGSITLHQLLSHTAGFPTMFDQHYTDLEQVVLDNGNMAMWSPPGAVWNYSNPGFSVAGVALEKAAAEPFAQLVATHVTGPAGMGATMNITDVKAGDFAHGHSQDPPYNSGPIAPDGAYFHTTYYGPMGGLWGSIRDLGRWIELHIEGGGAVLTRQSFELLRTAHTPTTYPGTDYGLGLFIRNEFNPRVYDHGGSSPGFLIDWQVIPEAGFGVALVVNGDWYFADDIIYAAQDRFVSLQYNPAPLPQAPDAWSHYVGQYNDPNVFGQVEIAVDGNRLMARFTSEGTEAELVQYYGDTYETQFRGETIDINFWRESPDQNATYLVSMWGVAVRTGP